VGTGTKEDESSTGRVWDAGFHHVTARSRLAPFETCEPFTSLICHFVFGPRQAADTESVDTGARLYSLLYSAKDTEISMSPNIRVMNLDIPVSTAVAVPRYEC
jgi:hypothetical protein